MEYLKRTWAEIDLDKALDNWQHIKAAANGRYIMPVVKADAYGHGANMLAALYEQNGAEGFAVSNINEAIKLRKFGIAKNILVLGFTPVEYIEQLYAFNITQTVYCADYAKKLSAAADSKNLVIKVHIKLDTGMCRIGFDCRGDGGDEKELSELIDTLSLPSLHFEGIFTHFSCSDSVDDGDISFSDGQYDRFIKTVDRLTSLGHTFKYVHCCNSAASLLRDDEGNLIRPGIILYGAAPAAGLSLGYTPVPVMSVKSSVSMVKTLFEGDEVSYGRTYKVSKPLRVATVPIGYADGYPRAMSGSGKMIINGSYAPVIGRVCMDQMMVDITGIDCVDIGTPVTVIGTEGDLSVSFDDIAAACGTISYEIMCNVSIRMPRVYKKDGKTVEVIYLGGTL